MGNFSTRLEQFINHLNISVAKFEQMTDVANGTFHRVIKDPHKVVGHDKILKISNVFPELNLDWLLSGTGTMLEAGAILREEPTYYNGNDDYSKLIDIIHTDKNISIEFLSQQKEFLAQQRILLSQQDRLIGIIEGK